MTGADDSDWSHEEFQPTEKRFYECPVPRVISYPNLGQRVSKCSNGEL